MQRMILAPELPAATDRARRVFAISTVGAVALLAPAFGSANAFGGQIEVAAAISLTGDAATFGVGSLEGIKLAIEEANADREKARIDLKVYDDKSTAEGAREIAAKVVVSPAALVIGPSSSLTSLAAGPIYAQAGVAAIATTA